MTQRQTPQAQRGVSSAVTGAQGFTQISLKNQSHPYLFLNEKELETIRRQAADASSFQSEYLRGLRKRLDRWLALGAVDVAPVPRDAAVHVCEACGIPLAFDLLSPHRHTCRKCAKVHEGEAYDRAWRMLVQPQVSKLVSNLGLFYAVTREEKYAREAGRILLLYADGYKDYPIENQSRLGTAIIRDSWLAVGLANGYDLICNSGVLTDEQKRHIEEDLFRPTAELMMMGEGGVYPDHVGGGISNFMVNTIQCALVLGLLLRDRALVDFAVNGPVGFHRLLADGVLDGGGWWEDAPGYHSGIMRMCLTMAEAARHSGIDLYGHPKFRAMFHAAVELPYPDGSFPQCNDCPIGRLSVRDCMLPRTFALYYARTGDDSIAHVLEPDVCPPMYPARGDEGIDCYSLWITPTWPERERPRRSALVSGKALMRTDPPAPAIDVVLDCGPHGGGHGHFDKLNLCLWANGRIQAPDPGISNVLGGYQDDLSLHWYRSSVAHNTIVTGMRNQRAGEGYIHLFATSPRLKIVDASPYSEYYGLLDFATQRRVVALVDDAFVIDICRSSFNGVNDWVYHNFGAFKTDQELAPRGALGGADGYQLLRNLRSGTSPGNPWSCTFSEDGQGVKVTGIDQAGGWELIAGSCPGIATDGDPGTMPILISRHNGPCVWKMVIEPYQTAPAITEVESLYVGRNLCGKPQNIADEGYALRIVRDGVQHFYVLSNSWGNNKWCGPMLFNGQVAYARYDAGTDPAKDLPGYVFLGYGLRWGLGGLELQAAPPATVYLQRQDNGSYDIANVGALPIEMTVTVRGKAGTVPLSPGERKRITL